MFKKLNEGSRLPERATRHSAGFDVFADQDMVIGAGETRIIGTGIAIDPDFFVYGIAGVDVSCSGEITNPGDSKKIESFLQSHYIELHIRSSLRAKGLTSLGTGIIDIDYTDEIKMIIHNPIISVPFEGLPSGYTIGYPQYSIKKGDKIGQLILKRHEGYLLPAEYTKDEVRTGGFGSTGR
jgi:dUTPase